MRRSHRCSCAARIGGRSGLLLLLVIASLWTGWPRTGVSEARSGTLILVGGVLRFNQRNVWNRITERAADLVVIAAASDRPKLYGDFARRALQRHGAFAEVLPLAVDSAEFGIDQRRATSDPALVEKVREAGGVFFVGGAPQRLAKVLFRADGSPTPMGKAVVEEYATGGVIVGGIPGSVGLSTGLDALGVLARGRVSPAQLHRGLGLATNGWFVDQQAFTTGRLAEILVAMRQLDFTHGLGIGANTAAVVEEGQVEVVGDEGVLLIDLSGSRSAAGSAGEFSLAGARLSYLEHGDSFDMATLEIRPAAVKLDGFEIVPDEEGRQPSGPARSVAGDLFAEGRLLHMLREVLDGSGHEASGLVWNKTVPRPSAVPAGGRPRQRSPLAVSEDAGSDGRGFRFRFHSVAETFGWLSVDSGMDRYTILNVGLDISAVRRKDIPDP